MTLTPEEVFYSSKGYLTGIPNPTLETAASFAPGKRYAIASESLKQIPLSSPGLIVELGCAAGQQLLWLKDRYHFSKAIGIDLRFSGGSQGDDECRFFSANLNLPWPLDCQTVDVLIAMMLLEHLFDPYHSFREIKRVLAPSGRAFINLPLITGLKNRFRLLCGQIPVTSVPYSRWRAEGHWDGFHLHYFNIPSIVDLASGAGLQVYKMKSVGKLNVLKNIWPSLLCDEISFELRHSSK